MIRAVFFDIDNTLFPTSKFAEKARRNAIGAMVREGLGADAEEAYGELAGIIKKFGPNYGHHFELLARKINGRGDARIVAAGIAAYHDTKIAISPFPGTREELAKMRRRYALYVVSEGVPLKQWDKLIRLGLQGFSGGLS